MRDAEDNARLMARGRAMAQRYAATRFTPCRVMPRTYRWRRYYRHTMVARCLIDIFADVVLFVDVALSVLRFTTGSLLMAHCS